MKSSNRKCNLFAICLLVATSSYLSCRTTCESFGETALGNKFALVEADEYHKSILYCTSPKCCYAGITVVPSNVISYKRNSEWVIAKSEDKKVLRYWIIDKRFSVERDSSMRKEIMSHVTGPLDSATFCKEIESRKIKLSFR